MTAQPGSWPTSTGELLPNTLFKLAKQFPNHCYAEYFSDPTDLAGGYRKVTLKNFADAVQGMAWWIEENIGKPEVATGTETMVYCGPQDLRYGILVLASNLVGYKMLFPSPRYGVEAITRLIEQVSGKIMLTPSQAFPVIHEVLQKREMSTFAIPTLEAMFIAKSEPYPFTKTFEEHKHEGFATLHTSGTTGFPKPISWDHDWANSVLSYSHLPAKAGKFESARHFSGVNSRLLFLFPAFHTSGIYGQIFIPLAAGMTLVIPPFAASPIAATEAAADTIDFLALTHGSEISMIALPPPHMEYLASNPTLLDRISRAKTVMFGGGAISTSAGRTVAKKMRVINDIGSTELGVWPSLERPWNNVWNGEEIEDIWQYTAIHPVLNLHFRFVAYSVDGDVGEAVVVRDDSEGGIIAPIFKIFPEIKEKAVGDLFVRHPRHPELWKHYGRADELINFVTTEKFHPAAAERTISAHEAVEEVMMVGTRRPKAALIVRLKEGKGVNDIWHVIEEVNKSSPVYAQLEREMVLVVHEPFLLTAKGSIQKAAMVEKYTGELDGLYGSSL